MGRSSHYVAVPGVCQRSYGDATIYCPYRPHSPPDPFPYGCYFPAHGSRVPNTYADSHPCSGLHAYAHPNGNGGPDTHSEANGNPHAHTGGSGSHDYADASPNTASRALPDSSPANPSAYPRGNSNSPVSFA